MTMSPIVRARVLGSVVIVLAFVAGIVTGMAIDRGPRPGINVTVSATNAIPHELERLDLTEAQRGQLREILTRGRDRVLTVVRDFEPRMRGAMDSTEVEISGVLTEAQRAELAAYRKDHPPFLDQRIIKGPDGKTIRK
jgi:hypothetical protein